jgi:hypothetical protein
LSDHLHSGHRTGYPTDEDRAIQAKTGMAYVQGALESAACTSNGRGSFIPGYLGLKLRSYILKHHRSGEAIGSIDDSSGIRN